VRGENLDVVFSISAGGEDALLFTAAALWAMTRDERIFHELAPSPDDA
jgi:hypothetical protein